MNVQTDWIEYSCKSGETLFIYNKRTGEHKWPTGAENVSFLRLHMAAILFFVVLVVG